MDSLGYTTFQTPSWTLSLKNALGEFSDLFSEFGKPSAPTYRHDRCERSVQMRLYTLNKRHFFLVFASFFICFGISLLVGIAGPPVTETSHQNASSLVPAPPSLQTGPFVIQSPPVSTFNQQLWLSARIETDYDKKGHMIVPVDVGVKIRGLLENNKDSAVYEQNMHNRSRTLKCDQKCDDLILLHLGFLDYPKYLITVHLYDTQNTQFRITQITFFFQTYNPSFTQLEIWFRFAFLVLTFITTCMFAHGLRCFSMRDWSIEQKWMSLLLPLLLLYNNPLFPLTFLVNSWIPNLCDAVFQTTFLCCLLLFWLCLYHGVRQNKRRCSTFYLPKMLIVGLIWFTIIMLSSWQHLNSLRDPTYNYRTDANSYFGFQIFLLVIGGLYVLYLVYLLVRAYAELRSMPYFDLRLKFMTSLVIIILASTITIYALRFGTSALQDNFVAELSTTYENSAEFLAFYGLLNFYLYTMAYVYSPSKNAAYESHFRDNPALSMLNDSDEDIAYGSEQEETTALTGRRVSTNRHDSEEEAFQ